MTALEAVVVVIPGLPLVAAALATADRVLGGRLLGARLLARVAVWGVGLSAVAATVAAAVTFANPVPRLVTLGVWLETGSVRVDVGLLLDPLSATLAVVVAGLSWLVTRFSVNYLHNEAGFGRYFTVLPLFVGAMLVLILADNYFMLFVGWEVVGACSYLLIAFYRDRSSAVEAGTRAFVLNRIGDAGLLAGLFILATEAGGFGYPQVLHSPLPGNTATAVGFCFLLGAIGKSAQVPLAGWLARAMEGPTPSSALIHGATMVTAGVYLVVRSAPIYEQAPVALAAVGVIGATTVLFGQLAGLAQTDIKSMLAASTNSHLGFMLLLSGLGLYPIAVFHLVAHAFYKTNLFLTAPSILHHLHGGPDPTAVAPARDTARVPGVAVGAVALVLLTVPFVAEPLSLPQQWARGAVVLGALGAVAAFALWFSTRRMVRATFDDESDSGRRTAIAVAVGGAVAAAGAYAGLLPGGISGSWFAELLAPTVRATTAAFDASVGVTAVLVIALSAVAMSGIAVPRYFDRFRAEQPAGAGSAWARRLYFAALNRAWLDDLADRTTTAAISVGAAVDRFDRAVLDPLTGAFVPARARAPEPTLRERVAAAGDASELEWLTTPGTAPAPATVVERISAVTARIERRITSQGGGLYGALTDAISAFSDRAERVVFQRGIERVVERVTVALAVVSETVERRVFELGPDRVATFGDRVRRMLLDIEGLLGRPVVAALVAAVVVAVLSAVP